VITAAAATTNLVLAAPMDSSVELSALRRWMAVVGMCLGTGP
jgi:hypothetical protein